MRKKRDRVPTIAEHAAYVASQCPPLTDEQKAELRRIFASFDHVQRCATSTLDGIAASNRHGVA